MIPPSFPFQILAVLLIEMLFGLGYNRLVAWAQENDVWRVWFSVVMGVAVTLVIPTAWWWKTPLVFWQSSGLLFCCFAASGLPMVAGSAHRHLVNHKRRALGNAARQLRDEAVMDLTVLAGQVAKKQITAAEEVNRIHEIIGTLTSMK